MINVIGGMVSRLLQPLVKLLFSPSSLTTTCPLSTTKAFVIGVERLEKSDVMGELLDTPLITQHCTGQCLSRRPLSVY